MCIRDRCVVDSKTNMLESNQKEIGQQIITVNDKLESFVSKAGNKFEGIKSEMQCITNTIHACLLYTSRCV